MYTREDVSGGADGACATPLSVHISLELKSLRALELESSGA